MVSPDRGARSGLIVTRTPLRVSFAGGGTDLPEFYERGHGAVLSTAIDKYVWVTVKRHNPLFGENFRLNYSETEHVDSLDDIKNDIARECLRLLDIEPPIYISTVGDLPAFSGLGSSSSFAVGLLNALHALRGERVGAGQLAHEACHVEIEVLRHPIGRQDQYAAAFGGLNYFAFRPGGSVSLEPQRLAPAKVTQLFDHLLLFWTGMARDSKSVLSEQRGRTSQNLAQLEEMRGHAERLRDLFRGDFDPLELGRLLDKTWRLKRGLASTITNERIDDWYRRALDAGAVGGKILGAGGGGFLLFVTRPEDKASVRKALGELQEIQASYEAQGSRLLMPHIE